jgi:hypothetical protein
MTCRQRFDESPVLTTASMKRGRQSDCPGSRTTAVAKLALRAIEPAKSRDGRITKKKTCKGKRSVDH